MHEHTNERRDHRLAIGFLAGAAVGAGLMMWLAPRAASELRKRLTDSAAKLGDRASARYDQATDRVSETVDEFTRKAQAVRDDVAGAVARGAHEVERLAKAAKSGA